MPSIAVILNNEQIVDAYAYRSEIYCWSVENVLLVYKIESLIAALERAYGQTGLGVAHALFSTRGIGTRPKMARAFSDMKPPLEPLNLQVEPASTFRLARDFDFVLDLRIHYDRLYLATEKGAFALSIRERDERIYSLVQPDVLHESYSYSLSTGLRAVAMSLGKLGLSIVLNEAAHEAAPRSRIDLPDKSIRSSISSSAVANFSANDECRIYRADSLKGWKGANRMLVDVSAVGEPVDTESTDMSDSYIYWDGRNNRLVSATANRISGYMPKTKRKSPTLSETYDLDSQPLSVAMTGNHYVAVESESRVTLTRQGQSFNFETGTCLSVRTYRGSYRFRKLVTCTADAGLWLVAAYGADYF